MGAQNKRDTWIRCDTLFTPSKRMEDCMLRICGGKIAELLPVRRAPGTQDAEIIYQEGTLVAPGFMDLHVHGAGGRDLMDGTCESLQAVSSTLARHGTTAFLATTLSAPDSDTETAIRGFVANRNKVLEGAVPLGLHLEGPFLNPVRKGTHNSRYLALPSIPALRRFVETSGRTILKMTIAPELDQALPLIREAVEMGIQVSMGHSDATVEQARTAVEAGATQATHVFNAMRPFQQREPGILGLVLTDDRVYAELIADGIHVHPTAVEMLVRLKGADRTLLITDGLSAVDMPEGKYPLGDKMVLVSEGACRDFDGTLAGSTLTLDRAVRNLVKWIGLPLEDALTAASASPARSMRLAHKGVIEPGADADLVFLDPHLNVVRTMVAGRIVFSG